MAYVRTHAAMYVARRGRWAAWRARIAGGSGAEQWERYQAEVSRGGRPVYHKNEERWRTRCAEGRWGQVSGSRRRREPDRGDADTMVRRWQRVSEGEDALDEASTETDMGEGERHMPQRAARGRRRRVRGGDVPATEMRIRRRAALYRAGYILAVKQEASTLVNDIPNGTRHCCARDVWPARALRKPDGA